MIGSIAVVSRPTMQTDTSTASSSSSRPSGRLRGLSYLRNYSHSHDRSDSTSSNERTPRTPVTSNPSNRAASSATVVAAADSNPSPDMQHQRRQRSPVIGLAAPIPSTSGANRPRSPVIGLAAPFPSRSGARPDPTITGLHQPFPTASRATTGGWLPSVDGSPGLARATTQLQPSPVTSRRTRHTPTAAGLSEARSNTTRIRSATSPAQATLDLAAIRSNRRTSNPTGSPDTESPSASSNNPQLPSIQLMPYQDPRSSRPSLDFRTMNRTLPDSTSILRVGRYSERDTTQPGAASDSVTDAPIGFKSKVVSRRHCEFFYQNNQWFIKDVKSSSGTFLNHIRLSPPGEESRPYQIRDGDVVQLGIDFKGGEEMIFRCVKIKVLCNRGWQKSINRFNKSAHKRLSELQRSTSKDVEANANSTECTICLNAIAPCQSLFVAPCSHTWHYKCIRPMLEAATRTHMDELHFQCPNCRNVADLDADIDEGPAWDDSDVVEDEEEEEESGSEGTPEAESEDAMKEEATQIGALPLRQRDQDDALPPYYLNHRLSNAHIDGSTSTPRASIGSQHSHSSPLNPGASDFVPASASAINVTATPASSATANTAKLRAPAPSFSIPTPINSFLGLDPPSTPTAVSGTSPGAEGPLTPRNNAGPFVFDGGVGLD